MITKTQAKSIADHVADIVESVKNVMKTDSDGKNFVKQLIGELKKLLK